jgi:hypothetical protein
MQHLFDGVLMDPQPLPSQLPVAGPSMGQRDPNAGFHMQVADTTLSEATIVLRKRRWVLIFAALLGFIFGMYRSWTQPQLYTATGEIQVRPGASAQYRVDNSSFGSTDTSTRLQTEFTFCKAIRSRRAWRKN